VQGLVRHHQVLQRGAVAAARVAQDVQHLGVAQGCQTRRAASVQGEGQRRDFSLRGACTQPARVVHAVGHLALPQALHLACHVTLADAIHGPLTGTALQQGKHQAGPLGRASVHARAHAQGAVPPVDQGTALFCGLKFRPPQQRGIAQHPQIAASSPLAKRALKQRRWVSRIGQWRGGGGGGRCHGRRAAILADFKRCLITRDIDDEDEALLTM